MHADANGPDMHVADGHHEMPLIPQEPPSDAVVVPASPSFPSGSRPAALRALASLPFHIKRGSRRGTNHNRDASPTPNPNHNSAELHTPRSQSRSRGLSAPPAETPSAPAPSPSRPVVAFRNYKQFLFQRSGEIQSAPRTPPQPSPPPHSAADVNMPPPPLSFMHSNPLAEPPSPYARRGAGVHPTRTRNSHHAPDEPPQELSMRNHSRHPSAVSSDDEGKEKDEGMRPDLAAGQLSELEYKGSSFAVGRLRSEATLMALETGGSMMSHAAGPPGPNNSSFDGSTVPTPTREWQPRSIRSSKKISQGAEQRPGRHRYTYGNESIKSRQTAPSDVSRSPSRTAPAPRARMVRQASNVSLVSTGTPLELKGDYESFMVADGEEVRDSGDKTHRGVLSKLAPHDAVNTRSPAAQYAEPQGGGVQGGYGLPLGVGSGGGDGKARREWQPRFKRSKSKLELGGERSDGSSFAYSFMYGIGSEHEAAMQEVLRESRKERAQKRQLRRSESTLSHATHEHTHGSPAQQSAMSRMSGMDVAEGAMEFRSWDGEQALLDPEHDLNGSRGVVDFGGLSLAVGPSFKQYKFPMGRYFRFSDGNAVPVPFERRL